MTFRSAGTSALFTDLYELTMAQAYWTRGMRGTAVFELFFRRLPRTRGFALAAGLSDVLEFLEGLRFEPEEIDYLRSSNLFSEEFLGWLPSVRFTGDVWALPEGTVVLPNEPIVQVVAPIIEAQLVETLVLNQVHLQSVMASKAARVVTAARGRTVVEFGSRRAHGVDAASKVARAAYLAGAQGTSNLLAAMTYGMPAFGTMAHSFVQAFDDELDAFAAFASVYPRTTLLVDTYDTLVGVDRVIELARRLRDRFQVRAVRLDSGDLGALSKATRGKLDAAGLEEVGIFASSGLDEWSITELLAAESPVDGFGVGTQAAVSADAPTLDMAYKLVEYEGRGRTKLSGGKVILPGRKQVFRRADAGPFREDTIGRFAEALPGEPLLTEVMRNGKRTGTESLQSVRQRAAQQIAALPAPLRSLDPRPDTYVIHVSPAVLEDLERLRRTHG